MVNNAKVEENSIKKPKGFQKGSEKPKNSGRKKGTPNKRTQTLIERLEGVDIVGELLTIAKITDDLGLAASIYKDLMKYVYPQRKAVEVSTKENNMSMAEFMQGLEKVAN